MDTNLNSRCGLQLCSHRQETMGDRGHGLWLQVQSALKDTGRMSTFADRDSLLIKLIYDVHFPLRLQTNYHLTCVSCYCPLKWNRVIQYTMYINIICTYIFFCSMSSSNCWPAYSFLRRQVRWSAIPISKNFPQCVVAHTVKGFGIVSKAE